ncbi:hypothetical protein D6C85_09029 [Aureobasidium pullulans]|uniref:Uncharacterized protein n=1 Tax=Aureobasidium pullulans TaxID=5580 RepID=A0A4S8ZHM0_AURPU|nr:hypothetical protein D6D20_02115 [Aureobasidium pullulans]THY05866.1 hypothetical protein D6D03_02763 [Aureobasidium pullulans]THZ63257.1 hypothetical protein D6C85_09029 [Aureobasidium pullulans]TIA69194.1 hypothetical protein D6C76_07931 [Aureobasidium pullulans]
MSRRKAKQSRTKSNVDRSKGSKTPKETPILVSRIINRIRKRHLPVSQITKQVIIAETSREYPDLYQKKANRKARLALKHLLKDTHEDERQWMLNWTRSVEVKKETSTGKVEEADNVKLEDEEDQDDVDDHKPKIHLDQKDAFEGADVSDVDMEIKDDPYGPLTLNFKINSNL